MTDKKIIAVDFDGTLFELSKNYPQVGEPKMEMINKCKELQKNENFCLILWTCREGENLEIALNELKKFNLVFDYINENPKWAIEKWGNDCRKLGAIFYIDDKNLSFEEFLKL